MELTLDKSASPLPGSGQPFAKRRARRIPLLERLFVWSLVLELLLFFVLFERAVSGLTSNLARLIQGVVVIGLAGRLAGRVINAGWTRTRVINVAAPLYANYSIYFVLAVFAGLIGFASGAYDLPGMYEINADESGFSKLVNSKAMRPIVEYFVTVYYFLYFIVLPRYMLTNEARLAYFFRIFKIAFVACFVIGAIDLAFASINVFLVPRHIADWRYVGARFHGLAGEPRDAFVYLFFALAVLHLHAFLKGSKLSRVWVGAIIVAALLTQSASGLIGILFFMGLYGVYGLGRITFRRLVQVGVLFTVILAVIYVAITSSERLMDYVKAGSDLWHVLETGGHIPYLVSVQLSSIYPLYDLTVKFRNMDLVAVLLGSGLGSASVINNVYNSASSTLDNPTSQFVRLIFESGVIGTYFFVMAFVYPVKRLTSGLSARDRRQFMLVALLLIGCFFGHRSAAAYIYVGILIATFRILADRVPAEMCRGWVPTRN